MTDAAESLSAHLSTIPESTGFTVDTLEKAMWAARKVARNDRLLRDAEDAMNVQVVKITEWYEAEKRRLDTGWLREELVRFHRAEVERDIAEGVPPGKVRKTYPLVDGVTLTRRAAKGSVVVTDVDALPSELVTWMPLASKEEIRKRIDAGEDVPGAQLRLPDNADDSGFTWTVRLASKNEES